MKKNLQIREIRESELRKLGNLMIDVYSKLEGFPAQSEQPRYYETLADIGRFTEKKDAKVLVAIAYEGELVGGVVYFGDMAEYGSGGSATNEKNVSGIRFLAVDERFRNMGVGKALTLFCIDLARNQKIISLSCTRPRLCKSHGIFMKNLVLRGLKTWISCKNNFQFLDLDSI